MKIIWKTVVLVILTSFLIYLCSINLTPLQQLVYAEGEASRSTIGGQEVNSLDREEIISFLNSKVIEWKEQPIKLVGNNVNIELLPEWFDFDVESTVNEYIVQTDKAWFAFWASTPTVHIPLKFSVNQEVNNLIEEHVELDSAATYANIVERVGMLSTEPIESVALDMSLFQTERIAFDIEDITINTNSLNDIISILNAQIIDSGEVFSLNEHIEPLNIGTTNEASNFIASLLYSVVLQTNFEIIERHSQGKITDYLEPGIEAEISSSKDLRFINTNNAPASLKVSIKGSSLLVEIYSVPMDTIAKYQMSEKQEITPRTIYRYSSELAPNKEELIQEGKSGLRVSVYRTISDKAGPFEKEELISKDYYPPVNRIVLKSSIVPETTTIADPDLSIDMNGDGLTDIDNTPDVNNAEDQEGNTIVEGTEETTSLISPVNEEVSDGLPKGSYYDKAGNIIDGSK